jgi:hypothetical protein
MNIKELEFNPNKGVNGFEEGDRVILASDPFAIYHVKEVTRAGRLKIRHSNGTIRSVTATACMHPYEEVEK